MKLIKKTFISLFVFIVITTVILWGLTQSINPIMVKDLLNKQLTKLTRQKINIAGDISWHLFPKPGITVSDISIGEQNKESNFSLSIENLLFNLEIAPLIRAKLVFNELKVDGFRLTINPQAKTSTTFPKTVGNKTQQSKNATKLPAQFAIDRFLLTRGQILVIQPQNKLSLSRVQIIATTVNLMNEIFPIQLKGKFSASYPKHQINATINFKGRINLTTSIFTEPQTALQNTVLDGRLLIQDLQFNQLKVAKINANLTSKAGQLNFNPLNISLYHGESVGNLSFQFDSKKLSINQTATGLNAEQLFKDILGDKFLKGTLDFSVHATNHLDENNWLSHLRANGNVTIKDGSLCFVNISKLIQGMTDKINSLLTRETLDVNLVAQWLDMKPMDYKSGDTKFQLLSVQYGLHHPMSLDHSLLLQTEQLQLKGDGRINLNTYAIDDSLSVKLVTSDQRINHIQQLLDGNFPLRLTGTLTKPIILPDIQKITPILSRYLLKKSFEKPINQLQKLSISNLLQNARF